MVTAKIYVNHKATLKFCKAKSVPFALQSKIEVELDHLQEQGVIEAVQFSDWAATIVLVLKGNGKVCIYGDYKVTINRVAKLDKYPIPQIED